MKILNILGTLIVVVALQGCATYGTVTSVPVGNQRSIYKDGRNTIISVKQDTVAVTPLSSRVTSGERGYFIVAVNNGTSQNFVFSTDDITATATNGQQTERLKVYSYQELVREEKTRQAWAAFGAALQGTVDSVNAENAGYSTTYGTYSGSAYGSNGVSAYGHGSYSSTTYNYAAAQAAQNTTQAHNEARLAKLAEQGQARLRTLASTILKKETIFPGAWHSGVVEVDLPKVTAVPERIHIGVDAGEEDHQFTFMLRKAQE